MASAPIPTDGQTSRSDALTIRLSAVTPNSLTITYQTLNGYLPLSAKNWIGLWQGDASPYGSSEPIARGAPATNASHGTIALTGLSLPPSTPFTLVNFAGSATTDAAATLAFTTSA